MLPAPLYPNHSNLYRRLLCLKLFIPPSLISFGWSSLDRWYYGVRYARGCHPNDLWASYFTSSKHVQIFREEHGEPDVIEVRQTFPTDTLARAWEHKVLRRMKVIYDNKWLNKSQGKTPSRFGFQTSEETKAKMSTSAKGRPSHRKGKSLPEETKQKMRKPKSDIHKENIRLSRMGKLHSEETRSKLKNRIMPDEAKKKIGIAHKGKPLSEEHKRKISESLKRNH